MSLTSLYPVLMTDDLGATAGFYRDVIGMETTFTSDWYVSFRRDGFELAVLDRSHETVPAAFRRAPSGGILINVEVEDAGSWHTELIERRGLPVVQPLRDEDFGQRHFIIEAPDGVLLDVISPIPPSQAFADAYAQGSSITG
jgi:catechol 2,3-dioxygenase-like lactoylglutathione lyase family enzyme